MKASSSLRGKNKNLRLRCSKPLGFILFLILLSPIKLLAQQPLNLDFEMQSIEGLKRPWGWVATSWGTTFTMDSIIVSQGNHSLHSINKEGKSDFNQSMEFETEPYELRGKDISITGLIKGKGVNKAVYASVVYWQYDAIANTYFDDPVEIKSEVIFGTFDWRKITINLKVPKNASTFKIKMNHQGLGEAWFDDFALSIENEHATQLRIATELSEENIKWLEDRSQTFSSPLPLSQGDNFEKDDFIFFKEAIHDAKIVALGESTHGTSEFFSLKHKLLQYAVINLGFRVFALEDHLMAGEDVNDFVTKEKGH